MGTIYISFLGTYICVMVYNKVVLFVYSRLGMIQMMKMRNLVTAVKRKVEMGRIRTNRNLMVELRLREQMTRKNQKISHASLQKRK